MICRSALAIAVLLFASGSAGALPRSRAVGGGDSADKKICHYVTDTGTRLGTKQICRTKAEEDQRKLEESRAVNRIQQLGATACGMDGVTATRC
ncbi:MAG TPA: hypothetical protein VGD66_04650 [Allosphingosinicella sp.]|jgi:hypothetical protein